MFFGKEMHEVATWATSEDAKFAANWLYEHEENAAVVYSVDTFYNTHRVLRWDCSNVSDGLRGTYITKGLLFAMMQLHAYDTSKHDALACIPYYREMPKERPHVQG